MKSPTKQFGELLYTLATPSHHNWIPSHSPALSQGTRLYYAGARGTVYYCGRLDSAGGPSGQFAFYGNALYAANQAAFDGSVIISTPITADRHERRHGRLPGFGQQHDPGAHRAHPPENPETGLDALVMDYSSVSPIVGPDGDVY